MEVEGDVGVPLVIGIGGDGGGGDVWVPLVIGIGD